MLIVREDLQKLSVLTDEKRFANISMTLEWIRSIAKS